MCEILCWSDSHRRGIEEQGTIAFNFDQEASAYPVLAEKLKDLEIGVLGVLIVHMICANRQ